MILTSHCQNLQTRTDNGIYVNINSVDRGTNFVGT